MFVNECRDHCDRNHLAGLLQQTVRIFVLHADHILTIDFQQLVIDEHTVSGGRRILDDRRNATVAQLDAQAIVRVLVQCDGALEWTITDDHRNIVDGAFLDQFVQLIDGESSDKCAVYLKDLCSKIYIK